MSKVFEIIVVCILLLYLNKLLWLNFGLSITLGQFTHFCVWFYYNICMLLQTQTVFPWVIHSCYYGQVGKACFLKGAVSQDVWTRVFHDFGPLFPMFFLSILASPKKLAVSLAWQILKKFAVFFSTVFFLFNLLMMRAYFFTQGLQ